MTMMMMVLNKLDWLISNKNKSDSNCSFNKKSNHDRGGNCASDNDEKMKCYPRVPRCQPLPERLRLSLRSTPRVHEYHQLDIQLDSTSNSVHYQEINGIDAIIGFSLRVDCNFVDDDELTASINFYETNVTIIVDLLSLRSALIGLQPIARPPTPTMIFSWRQVGSHRIEIVPPAMRQDRRHCRHQEYSC
jgi:hypothetical protein